ncbi:hypothetical protein VNO78_05084 [Psophocarpus tetragonolobus]|uniref:Serine/threonine-protein phosphatase 4 regulatory subunit 2 n=1 Tax=Psophocarpus tetragonolobus TaxID=3891 RepID=A0AAN9STG0_PSOTE
MKLCDIKKRGSFVTKKGVSTDERVNPVKVQRRPTNAADGDGGCKPLKQEAAKAFLFMEGQSHENLPVSSNDANNDDATNHRDAEKKQDVSREQVVQILQVIASTGRFWHDWDKLKSMLSFQLKQVLSEYPEAKMTSEQQYASLGESYIELVNKLDEALTCFIDGPPFTLQRLCEILLDAKTIYPNLSKLALALEKNLLVTSTLAICMDPYPQATAKEPDDQEKASEKQKQQSESTQNGIEPLASDRDEVMTDADVGDDMTIDMETFEGIKSSETNTEPNANNA